MRLVSSADDAVSRFIEAARREWRPSPNTVAAYRTDLTAVAQWLAERKVPITRAKRSDLQDFIAWRVRAGAQPTSLARAISSCRRFFGYLMREGAIRKDPTAEIELPKITRTLPLSLTEEEVEALLTAPVVSDPRGKRDRTMLEVLYWTGLSASELVNLRTDQIDLHQGVIHIHGKGYRARVVPLGEEAARALKEYIGSVRNEILRERHSDYLFPTGRCDRMSRQAFWRIIKRYACKAGVGKELSPRSLRLASALHMLSRGADLRVVQALLGQSDWSGTQLHRHAARERLKALRA